ncbi:MAG: hypothetical protein HRU12_05545, partial [Phaeodactylibacter sp.]|nr:hypothetical protein [Phaeodactylibacter sp.]
GGGGKREEKNTVSEVPISYQIGTDGKTISIEFIELLKNRTDYKITYDLRFKQFVNNQYKDIIKDGEIAKEVGEYFFTSGALPKEIVPDMLEKSATAPGPGQRYWTKGYAQPMMRFIKKMDGVAQNYFPEKIEIEEKEYDVEYLVEVTEHPAADNAEPIRHLVEVDAYPTTRTVEVVELKKPLKIAGTYEIPQVGFVEIPIREVLFSGLNSLDLQPYSLCHLRLIGRPIIERTDAGIAATNDENLSFIQKKESEKKVNDNTKILYEYH